MSNIRSAKKTLSTKADLVIFVGSECFCTRSRSLALLAAYRSLSAGISPAVFASATLALASLVLITLQQPWKGKSIGYSIIFKLLVQVLLDSLAE